MDKKKKIDIIAKSYLKFCTHRGLVVNGKLNSDYFKLRNFFMKKDDSLINALYNYCTKQDSNKSMTLIEFYSLAECLRNKELIDENDSKLIKASNITYGIDQLLSL